MHKDLLIYYPSDSNSRLDYVASHLFGRLLGISYSITADKNLFLDYLGPTINYSNEDINHGLHICSVGLIEETGIRESVEIEMKQWKGFPCFFFQKNGDIPFDIFSASFYLLSRYEEYTTSAFDKHGRFDPKESLAYKNHFLEIPLVDRWAYLLKDELQNKYPNTEFSLRRFRFVSTFDIDSPYQYQKRTIFRTIAAFGKDVLLLKLRQAAERVSVLLRLKDDPHLKAIQWIAHQHQTTGKEYFLFILRGARGKYGRSTTLPLTDYYHYLKELELANLALHPSYHTHKDLELLIKEKQELEHILDQKITISRNHYLRINIPGTFQELSLADIQDDYSLAYAHMPGFRSSTAVPHYFYDLEEEKTTGLLLHPTIMMDTTLISHLKLSPKAGLAKIKSLIDECYQSGGDYVSLWHNSNLIGDEKSNPWVNVFIESFQYASALEKIV